jgi:hypothetical protein
MAQRADANDGTPRRSRTVGGFIARMRDWLSATEQPAAAVQVAQEPQRESASIERIGPFTRLSSERRVGVYLADAGSNGNAGAGRGDTVIALPVNRRQQLNQLAQEIRIRFGDGTTNNDDPLLLTLVSAPQQCLRIDSSAYIEVLDETLPYRVVLGDELTTRVILETADFVEAHNFILQYLFLTRDAVRSVRGSA